MRKSLSVTTNDTSTRDRDALLQALAAEFGLQCTPSSVGGLNLQREVNGKAHSLLEFERNEEVLTHAAAVGSDTASEAERWDQLVLALNDLGLTIKGPGKKSGLYAKWYWLEGDEAGSLFKYEKRHNGRIRDIVYRLVGAAGR